MIPYKYIKPISYILITAFLASCSSSYEVTRRSEFLEPESLGTLTVYTKSGKVYRLDKFSLQDSTVTGIGSLLKSNFSSIPFSGPINISDIKRIQSTQSEGGAVLLSIGIGAALLITFLAFLSKEKGMTNEVHIVYPQGSGCSMGFSGKYDRPLAGGYKNVLDIETKDFDNIKYVNAAGLTDTIHFAVSKEGNIIGLEMIKEINPMANSNEILTVDILSEER